RWDVDQCAGAAPKAAAAVAGAGPQLLPAVHARLEALVAGHAARADRAACVVHEDIARDGLEIGIPRDRRHVHVARHGLDVEDAGDRLEMDVAARSLHTRIASVLDAQVAGRGPEIDVAIRAVGLEIRGLRDAIELRHS